MPPDSDITRELTQIDRARSRLRKMLRARDQALLNRRTPAGDWSIVENVRHLLWAEQRHLGRFLPGRVEWSPVGITAFRGREFANVGARPSRDIEVVFAEWDRIHASIRSALKAARPGSDTAAQAATALSGNHRHLLHHINIIEALLPA